MKIVVVSLIAVLLFARSMPGQGTQPLVAVHDSELTRALESMAASYPTPSGLGTTGFEWWPTNWHYFVMPESVKEALRSDGTAFTTVGDSDIGAGFLVTNGVPRFPILISLASEAIGDDEIAQLTNYVAAGGFLLVGSSSFTRHTNGTTRGDFAFGTELGVHTVLPGLTNWAFNSTFSKSNDHRLVSHIPAGQLTWQMAGAADEITWGTSPAHPFLSPHLIWRVNVTDATTVAAGDFSPYVVVKPFGKGWFIYHAGLQPLIGHSGFAPSMYSYVLFRRAIEWAFETMNLPMFKVSPWPYAYDAALMVRHDLENFTNEIAGIESSAQVESALGAKGDYYFCTGTLRDDAYIAYNTNTMIAGLRRSVTNYGATIGPHNGGLKNPNNPTLARGQYDYWHWGPDEAIGASIPGYADGKAYAMSSISNSFTDVESWLSGISTGPRIWTACYFNATREESYDLEEQLGVRVAGDQKIGPFPHWTLSNRSSGKHFSFLSEPVSDWFVNGLIAQSLEPWHPPGVHTSQTVHDSVDFYYGLGALINLYSHTLSTGLGDAGQLVPDSISYSLNTNLHPRLWSANGQGIYDWWLQRSNAQIIPGFATNSGQCLSSFSIQGASHPETAVEVRVPGSGSAFNVEVCTNSTISGGDAFRISDEFVRVRVGGSVSNVQIKYVLGPRARNDFYSTQGGSTLNVSAPGVLGNDSPGLSTNLTAFVISGPGSGDLILDPNGGFSYSPANASVVVDNFTYGAIDEHSNSSVATVFLVLGSPGNLFGDDFTRASDPGLLLPWVAKSGNWAVTAGVLQGGTNPLQSYAFSYITNNWTNYSIDTKLKFPAGAFGGGLGGRLNPVTGKHYAAWVYPEGSPGGAKALKLIKFSSWSDFGYNNVPFASMQQVTLPAVGTNWHALKLAFQGNQIAVYFDGALQISVADTEAQPHPRGGVSFDMWTESPAYKMSLDDLKVNSLVNGETYEVAEDSILSVPPPGVLTNDTGVFGTNLSAVLITGPTNGTLDLGSNGGFTYTPNANYQGLDSFTYRVQDGPTNLGNGIASITISSVNDAPALPFQADRTLAELTTLEVINTATDADVPAQQLAYNLINPPDGAHIDITGMITWTPAEAQGPGEYLITSVVTDNGTPPLSATNRFTVTVTEQNTAPVLPAQPDFTIAELTLLQVTNTATDVDLPANSLTYEFATAPAGADINRRGVISWAPAEIQGPGTNLFEIVVTDDGIPPLSHTNRFTVTVVEVNTAPTLPDQINRTISRASTLVVTNTAFDFDLPPNNLSYALSDSPAGAQIDANGVITWAATNFPAPGETSFTTVVSDDGVPSYSATNYFTVTVVEESSQPLITSVTVQDAAAAINWTSIIGRTYRLEFKDNLSDQTWTQVAPDVTATSSTTTATNLVGETMQRFYRVVLLP